jgi:phage terminase small subunit
MAGRPAKPIDLHLAEGRKHLTKEEIEARRAQENGLRSHTKFRPSDKVMQNPVALQTFKKLKKLYKEIDYVDGLDELVINRYCIMTAEVESLEKMIARMDNDLDECENADSRVQLYKTIQNAEMTVNRLRDMLLKIEDRLFLNPTARIKNVPQKPKEEPHTSKWDSFTGGMNRA